MWTLIFEFFHKICLKKILIALAFVSSRLLTEKNMWIFCCTNENNYFIFEHPYQNFIGKTKLMASFAYLYKAKISSSSVCMSFDQLCCRKDRFQIETLVKVLLIWFISKPYINYIVQECRDCTLKRNLYSNRTFGGIQSRTFLHELVIDLH